MTEIENKALALLNECAGTEVHGGWGTFDPNLTPCTRALCRAIEQHEAFRQEVSDAVVEYFGPKYLDVILAGYLLERFIIPKPKPDPLVEVLKDLSWGREPAAADKLRAALEARGLEIREKSDDDK